MSDDKKTHKLKKKIKKINKTTVKMPPKSKLTTVSQDHWDLVAKKPGDFLQQYNKQPDIIASIILEAQDLYHNQGTSPISDSVWDLLSDWLKEHYPEHPALGKIGADIVEGEEKKRVALPFHMGSMDKIKPGSGALERWQKKFPGDILVTTKLDGVSFLLTYSCPTSKPSTKSGFISNFTLYTRGNGKIGGDISNLLPYLTRNYKALQKIHTKCESNTRLTIRGEFIMAKEIFDQKYSLETGKGDFKNSRNLVAGLVNSKKIQTKIMKDIDLVGYEILEPRMTPSEQFIWMKSIGFPSALCHQVKGTTYSAETLSQDLLTYRESSPYEIDGLVILHDKLYPVNPSGNPKHAFAFKTLLQHDRVETTVLQVDWNASKNGYLKPRLSVEPVQLDGVTIVHTTGFNAKFVQDMGIGPGAKIVIVRSGGVIPHIVDVTHRVTPAMPDESYVWTEGNTDIMLANVEGDEEVISKQLIHFFSKIGTKHVGPGIINRLMEYVIKKEIDTLRSQGKLHLTASIRYPRVLYLILTLTLEEIQSLDGFQGRLAERTHQQMHTSLHNADLVTVMAASQMCGRGVGERRLNMLFKEIPDLLTLVRTQKHGALVERICGVEGFQTTTAIPLVDNLPHFLQFYTEICKLDEGRVDIDQAVKQQAAAPEPPKGKLSGRYFLFTGGKDKECIAFLEGHGAVVESSFTSRVTDVIAKEKNPSAPSAKFKKAKSKGLHIWTAAEVLKL